MDRWVGKVAVVTGASAGIGLAISKALCLEGLQVVGLARRKAKMEKLQRNQSVSLLVQEKKAYGKCQVPYIIFYHQETSSKVSESSVFRRHGTLLENMVRVIPAGKGKFYAQECDVTNEDSVILAFQRIERDFGTVHILVNNAGIVRLNSLIDVEIRDIHDQFAVNVMGVIYCSREAIKIIKKGGQEAHVINMNSIQGHRVHVVQGLQFNAYSATKHAVTALTETLQKELLGEKIRITSISPGVVRSDIFESTDFDKSPYAHFPSLEAEDIANTVIFAISRPQHVQITELTIRPLGESI